MNSLLRPVVVLAGLIFLACGGDSGTPPDPDPDPTGQTVTARVTTSGTDLDADGYTIRLGTRSATVEANGTATFSEVATGTYEVRLEGVALNCLPAGGTTRSVTVGGSSGQVAFTVDCFVDFADGLPTVECSAWSLEASSGLPGDLIGAGSVPTTLEAPVVALVRTPDGSATGFAVFTDDEDGLDLIVPLHPSASIQGGEVLIRVTDASVACAPMPFTIDPLPSADGELGSVVDGLLDVMESQLAALETTPQELAAMSLGDVPTPLLPLAVVQRVLDHPDNPESLRAIARGTAPGDFPVATIDALLARSGLGAALEDQGAAEQRVTPSGPLPTAAAEDCTPDAIEGKTQRLSDCMGAARSIDAGLRALRDSATQRAALLVAGAVAVEADQRSAARLAMGTVVWSVYQQQVRSASALPSDIQPPVVEFDPERFDEDDDRTGTWSATVTATSGGWDFTTDEIPWDFVDNVYGRLRSLGVDTDRVRGEVYAYVLERVQAELGPDPMIPSEIFGPVRVDDPMWTEVEWRGEGGAIQKVDHTSYRAVATGTGLLNLEMPVGDAFGGSRVNLNYPVDVDPIEITIEPSEVFIAPDEQVTFQVTVENSTYPDDFLVAIKQGSGSPVQGSEGSYSLVYTPPPAPSFDDPDSLRVRHTATTGARANGPERQAFASIHFGKVLISPRAICLDTLEEHTFDVTVEGPENEEVEWSADVGTIDPDGKYRAPPNRPENGLATIRAEHVDHEQLADEVVVQIGCTCTFRLRVDGREYFPEPGDRVSFSDWGGPDQPYSLNYELYSVNVLRQNEEIWHTYTLPIDADEGTWPTGQGTWDVHAQGDFGLTDSSDLLYSSDDDGSPAQLTIDEYTKETSVSGELHSIVQVISTSPPFSRETILRWWFTVTVPPGYQRPAAPAPPFGYMFSCTVPGG